MADTTGGDDGLIQLASSSKALVHDAVSMARSSDTQKMTQTTDLETQDGESLDKELSLDKRFFEIKFGRLASFPRAQFEVQRREERDVIEQGVIHGTIEVPNHVELWIIAGDNVKNRWIEQGIWNDKWKSMADGPWKHEEPLESESEWKANTNKEPDPGTWDPLTEDGRRTGQSRSKTALRRKVTKASERDTSRPFRQFEYQVSKARERIEHELNVGDDHAGAPHDINTRAYESVKKKWIEHRIWDEAWGVLPGYVWKHERPLEEFLDDELIAYANKKFLFDETLKKTPHHQAPITCVTRKEDGPVCHPASRDCSFIIRKKKRRVRFVLPQGSEQDNQKTSSRLGSTRYE
ncbi:hypothetical protein F5Y13DRAFT_188052 [Hypoxylon sp. FL1857]|nr:hypothetical protein F5Y13DRAFT_188052 [Hypoxylon sp. FL1857]